MKILLEIFLCSLFTLVTDPLKQTIFYPVACNPKWLPIGHRGHSGTHLPLDSSRDRIRHLTTAVATQMYIFQNVVETWLSALCSSIAFGAFLQRRVGPPTLSQPHKHLDSCSIPGFVDIRGKLCYVRLPDKV